MWLPRLGEQRYSASTLFFLTLMLELQVTMQEVPLALKESKPYEEARCGLCSQQPPNSPPRCLPSWISSPGELSGDWVFILLQLRERPQATTAWAPPPIPDLRVFEKKKNGVIEALCYVCNSTQNISLKQRNELSAILWTLQVHSISFCIILMVSQHF